MKQKDLV